MNFHLIHTGKGQTRRVDLPAFVDVSTAVPASPQVLRDVAKFLSRRTYAEQRKAIDAAHTNYRPGQLNELGNDQCRYVIVDENNIMCGAKGHPWCDAHRAIVYRRGI